MSLRRKPAAYRSTTVVRTPKVAELFGDPDAPKYPITEPGCMCGYCARCAVRLRFGEEEAANWVDWRDEG